MITFRNKETDDKYIKWKKNGGHNKKGECLFCDKRKYAKEYKHWVLIKNDFPYDRYFRVCDMLSPKRHISGMYELTLDEYIEFLDLKKKFSKKYNVLLENFGATASLSHWHLHLLVYNDRKRNGELFKK